jgi:hypothetical protein
MKWAWLMLLFACAPPETVTPVAAPRPESRRIVVQLDHAIATNEARTGERFTARVINRGVREDTRVIVVVSESHRGDQDHDPVLRLTVKYLDRGSCRVPLAAHVTSAETEEVSKPPSDSYRAGAINGALLGGAMLWVPGFVSGFGIGFAGGAVKEARALKHDTILREGALLTLELERPIPACPLRSRI